MGPGRVPSCILHALRASHSAFARRATAQCQRWRIYPARALLVLNAPSGRQYAPGPGDHHVPEALYSLLPSVCNPRLSGTEPELILWALSRWALCREHPISPSDASPRRQLSSGSGRIRLTSCPPLPARDSRRPTAPPRRLHTDNPGSMPPHATVLTLLFPPRHRRPAIAVSAPSAHLSALGGSPPPLDLPAPSRPRSRGRSMPAARRLVTKPCPRPANLPPRGVQAQPLYPHRGRSRRL